MPSIVNNTQTSKDTSLTQQATVNETKSLKQFVNEDNPTLLTISTVFPFVVFPDTLRIDLQKVSIVHGEFFWSKREETLSISDILAVSVESGPLFATLIIKTKFFTQKPLQIKYLIKSEATLARRIIHGLVLVIKKELRIDETNPSKIIAMLEEVGKMS
ncbi:MAG: hypothetical protein Q8P72_06625 [Candidatus Roizmanbacteria bacterium]|nr:hypothetical protein [Candidatus Roizmanbacteria bacterium]